MKRSKGYLIVLEGLDGSGTTTQASLLRDFFTLRGRKNHLTCEPTDEPVGKLIRDALSGRLSSPGSGKKTAFSERVLCLLFAADRQEHTLEIEKVRLQGIHVICDRYILSSIAYQTLDDTISPDWIIDVNTGCSVPDLTLFLDVPVSECLKRLSHRKNRRTVYEKKKYLEEIGKNYKHTFLTYEKHFGPVRRIDGSLSPDKVHEAVIDEIDSVLHF